MSNIRFLIQKIEALPLLDGRFSQLKCVNHDLENKDARRGFFSVVFRGFDTVEQKSVAIKFYDPSPLALRNTYRVKAFEREPDILYSLLNNFRCLQLVKGLQDYSLLLKAEGQDEPIEIPCRYFVTEWVEDQIDEYFLEQEHVETIAKLQLFHEIVLSVSALHRNDVQHRDLKADNLRLKLDSESKREVVVAIDLGAAARAGDPALLAEYGSHVGHLGYAGPETLVGFSGDREFGRYTDYYALGCILYELFNPSVFEWAVQKTNPKYQVTIAAIALELSRCRSPEEKLNTWARVMSSFKDILLTPAIDGIGSSAPSAVANELNELLSRLTFFDFRFRVSDLDYVCRRLRACIQILSNKRIAEHRKSLRKSWKLKRLEKIRNKPLSNDSPALGAPKC